MKFKRLVCTLLIFVLLISLFPNEVYAVSNNVIEDINKNYNMFETEEGTIYLFYVMDNNYITDTFKDNSLISKTTLNISCNQIEEIIYCEDLNNVGPDSKKIVDFNGKKFEISQKSMVINSDLSTLEDTLLFLNSSTNILNSVTETQKHTDDINLDDDNLFLSQSLRSLASNDDQFVDIDGLNKYNPESYLYGLNTFEYIKSGGYFETAPLLKAELYYSKNNLSKETYKELDLSYAIPVSVSMMLACLFPPPASLVAAAPLVYDIVVLIYDVCKGEANVEWCNDASRTYGLIFVNNVLQHKELIAYNYNLSFYKTTGELEDTKVLSEDYYDLIENESYLNDAVMSYFYNFHSMDNLHEYDTSCSRECSICGCIRDTGFTEHTYVWEFNYESHNQICSICGNKSNSDNHSFGNFLNIGDKNYHRQFCDCGFSQDKVHQFTSAWDNNYPISCLTGLMVDTCNDCGYKVNKEFDSHIGGEATCSNKKICERCNEQYGDLLEHTFKEADCSLPVTCTSCGFSRGVPLGHSFAEATCTKLAECIRCGKTTGSLKEHSMKNADCSNPEKCTDCGYSRGVPLGHSMTQATCTSGQKCTRCSLSFSNALGHNYSSATCSSPSICSRCGVTSGSALGHLMNTATCSNPETCSRCSYSRGVPLGHSLKAATCSEAPKCIRCSVSVGSALGHSMNAATCSKPETCSRCSYSRGVPLGHSLKAATCTTPQKCTRCSVSFGSPLGHSYSSWSRYSSTQHKKSCTRCGVSVFGNHYLSSNGMNCGGCGTRMN